MSHPESVTEMSEPLLIKSAKIYALRLVLTTSNMTTITQAIEKKMQGSAAYYEDEPIVIDATTIPEEAETLNWKALVKLLQKQGFTVLGFTAPERMASAARKAGLISIELPAFENKPIVPEILVPEPLVAPITESSESVEIIAEQAAQPVESTDQASEETVPVVQAASASVADLYPGSLVIDKPLRSGQKVYAKGSDLVVMGMVSHGAEVIADGNIYVFGPLRGRAMAGASGQENCKIFATQFNAELIAIAGIYRALAEVPDNLRNKPTWVHLKENKLLLEPFSL